MQKFKCIKCGKSISKTQFKAQHGLCGGCAIHKPSPRILGKRLW